MTPQLIELRVKEIVFQNNNLTVRNLCSNIKCIKKADVYSHGHSLGLLAKPGNKLPVIRISFTTLLPVAFFPFCSGWFQKLLYKNGQENKKWFKFSHSHVGRSSHFTYIKYSLDQLLPQLLQLLPQLLPVIYSVKPTPSALKKCTKETCIFQMQEHTISCAYFNFLFKSTENEKKILHTCKLLKMKISQSEIGKISTANQTAAPTLHIFMLMTRFSACGQSTCRSPWHRGAGVPQQWGVPPSPPICRGAGEGNMVEQHKTALVWQG